MGTALLAKARELANGPLSLKVDEPNHAARAFYARFGFCEVGPYAFMVGTHADEDIVMRLDL